MTLAWFMLLASVNTVNRSSTKQTITTRHSWLLSLTVLIAFIRQLVTSCRTSCRRAAATICPAPLLPVGAEAPCAAERTATSSISHGQHVPTPTAAAAWRANTAVTLTFDLLTLKAVSESRVTWATSVPILVFLGLSVLDLGPMYATDKHHIDARQTAGRCQTASSLYAPVYYGRGIITATGQSKAVQLGSSILTASFFIVRHSFMLAQCLFESTTSWQRWWQIHVERCQ